MVTIEISCSIKGSSAASEERIVKIGGVLGDGSPFSISVRQAVDDVESGRRTFFVRQGQIRLQLVVATSANGKKYLKSTADGMQPMALLNLPNCVKQ